MDSVARTPRRQFHSIILDAGPLLQNIPPASSLIAKADRLLTVPGVLDEIKDVNARSRLETILKPFLIIRSPKRGSMEFVCDFAKKSGDFSVLSRTDLEVLALAYEVDCERHGGDKRLRKVPGLKRGANTGPPKSHQTSHREKDGEGGGGGGAGEDCKDPQLSPPMAVSSSSSNDKSENGVQDLKQDPLVNGDKPQPISKPHVKAAPWATPELAQALEHMRLNPDATVQQNTILTEKPTPEDKSQDIMHDHELSSENRSTTENTGLVSSKSDQDPQGNGQPNRHSEDERPECDAHDLLTASPTLNAIDQTNTHVNLKDINDKVSGGDQNIVKVPGEEVEADEDSGSDSDGWITPSNLKKHQAKDLNASTAPVPSDTVIEAACMTTDFACQNVLLQIGLDLLSPSFQRVRNLKTYILRCHACFQQVKDTSKQFCPRCGMPTLTRVSCSTNHKGEFRVHLKKNMQWSHRGDRYSIPKPVHGSANGKNLNTKGGGKGGWGNSLILAEDQKEYQRALTAQQRVKLRDFMDEDYVPGILSGQRHRPDMAKPKIGAGRYVNSRKRVS